MEPIRILLVDDHRLILDGIQGLLKEMAGMECVGTCANGVEALAAV